MEKTNLFHENTRHRDGTCKESGLTIRNAVNDDLSQIIELDKQNSNIEKPDYWQESLRRFGGGQEGRYFLVAEKEGEIAGFIVGEIRAWEFGAPPGGWVFSLTVNPDTRLGGVATMMFENICQCFRDAGVDKVHTMIDRDNIIVMSFFRSQGMMAGSTIPLEMQLSDLENDMESNS